MIMQQLTLQTISSTFEYGQQKPIISKLKDVDTHS